MNGATVQIAASRWSQSSGAWSAAQVIQPSTLRGSNPQIAVAPNGDATVVWTQAEPNGTLTIQASRRRSVTGSWSEPVALTPATGANGGNWPQAQADPAGNVLALWYQYQGAGVYSLDAARYDVASGKWGSTVHIETLPPNFGFNPFASAPTLVIDAAGNATAVWSRDDGSGGALNAFQARFDIHTGAWSAASSLSGSVSIPDRVFLAVDAQGAQAEVDRELPDLVLLDWMLPGQSGVQLARQWRSQARTRDLAVIMLTARAEEADKIVGLDAGADDYLTKPFSTKELMARMRAVLRRKAPEALDAAVDVAGLRLDPATRRVTRALPEGMRELRLGPTEFRLLHFLMTHPERVHSRAQLLDRVWGDHVFIEERTVDVHVKRLREALAPADCAGLIETVRGAGYRLSQAGARAA